MKVFSNSPNFLYWQDKFHIVLQAISALAIVSWVFYYCNHGFDFTDESYYLVWATNPFEYSVSASQFGFALHPFYKWLGGNVAAFRQGSVFVSFTLSWVLVYLILRFSLSLRSIHLLWRLSLSFSLAVPGLLITLLSTHWLPTPSYNSIAFQGLLLAMIGLLILIQLPNGSGILGVFLMGIGEWLAFMAKPTTAVAFATLILAYVALVRKISLLRLSMAVFIVVMMLVASAFMIDGSVVGFLKRQIDAINIGYLLNSGHNTNKLFRIDRYDMQPAGITLTVAIAFLIFLVCNLSDSVGETYRRAALIMTGVFTLGILATILGYVPSLDEDLHSAGLLFICLPLSLVMVTVIRAMLANLGSTRLDYIALALLFMVLPHAFAFGTNRNYWENAASAALFWMVGALVIFCMWYGRPRAANVLACTATGGLLVTATLINTGIESPERQIESLRTYETEAYLAGSKSPLMLSGPYAAYIEEAMLATNTIGLHPGDPIIDLTGQSPGILYAIGAKILGTPWLLGDYPGSNAFAIESLKRVSCIDLSAAWILIEPSGPRALSPSVVASFGADLNKDYESSAILHPAPGAGGYASRPPQYLLKPRRDSKFAERACKALR